MMFQPFGPSGSTPVPKRTVNTAMSMKNGPVNQQCTRPQRIAFSRHAPPKVREAAVQIAVRQPLPTFALPLTTRAAMGTPWA